MTKWMRLLTLCSIASLSGCVSVELENSARLMARPDFEAATIAAPGFVRDALRTINSLEQRVESGQ